MSDGEPLATAPPLVAAAREMRPRERLIWADRPASGTSLRETARGVLFGLGFAAFAAVWSGFAFILTLGNASAPFKWFPYFGIPFFLAGLLIAGGALFRLPVLGSRLYALSAERFLVLSDRPPTGSAPSTSRPSPASSERAPGWLGHAHPRPRGRQAVEACGSTGGRPRCGRDRAVEAEDGFAVISVTSPPCGLG